MPIKQCFARFLLDGPSFACSFGGHAGTTPSAERLAMALAPCAANPQSGIDVGYSFDITDRLTDIAWSGTMPAMSFSMQYSAADMITNVVYASGEKRVYIYDDLDRLTGERHYDASQTLIHNADYAYDLAGNRTQMVRNGVTNIYTLGVGNRLDTWTGGSYAYDPAGNVTNMTLAADVRSLAWNSQYQLTGVHANDTLVESYGYDPLGRRAWTYDGSVTNWHVHDGMHLVADLDDSGDVLRSYTWGPGIDNLLAMTVHGATETNTYFAITDHLGTVHALSDEYGNIVESYSFDAWGNVLGVFDSNGAPLSRSAIGNHYLHQGRWYSWSTGLYFHRARWRDPKTGRWLSNDPIGIAGGLNQYVAFANNPVMFRDWSGLCPEGERDVDWGYFEDYSLIDRLRGNTPKVLVIRDARPRIGMPVGNPIQFAFALQDAYNRSSFAPEPLPDYIKIGMLPAPSHLLGRGYPTKLNRAGQLQPYDPATGHYLSHSANPGAVMSPAGRFGAGFAQGWAESKGASGASPVGSAGKLGYALGNLFGSLF